jgi:hypothetical protein
MRILSHFQFRHHSLSSLLPTSIYLSLPPSIPCTFILSVCPSFRLPFPSHSPELRPSPTHHCLTIPSPTRPPNEQKSEEVLKAAVGLLGDLGQIFGSRMSQVYHMPFVKSVINPSCLSCLQCLMTVSTVMRLMGAVFFVLMPFKVDCCG